MMGLWGGLGGSERGWVYRALWREWRVIIGRLGKDDGIMGLIGRERIGLLVRLGQRGGVYRAD